MKTGRVGLGGAFVGMLVVGLPSAGEAQQGATGAGMLERAACVSLVRRQRALEAGGMRETMARAPDAVARERGPAFLQQVRDYIGLKETVLFRCPPNVLNATAAPLEERLKAEPPLPGKGPTRARPAVRQPVVPLPVPRPI